MAFSLQTHHFRRDPKTNHRILQKVTPYVAISTREGRLYAQSGKVWSEGGEEQKDPPEWFWNGWRKVSPEKRKLVGLLLPEEREAAAAAMRQRIPGAEDEAAVQDAPQERRQRKGPA